MGKLQLWQDEIQKEKDYEFYLFEKYLRSISKNVADEIVKLDIKINEALAKRDSMRYKIGNILSDDVPLGTNIKVVRTWGIQPKFSFTPKAHADIIEDLDIADVTRAAELSGARFYYLKNELVKLNLALIHFAFDNLIDKGYTPMWTPYLLRHRPIEAAAELEDFKDQLYKIEGEELYLIATAEQTLAAFHMDEVLDENKFVIYEISSQGEPGINNLWELIKEFMADKPYNFYEKRAIILTINQDINPIKGIVYDEQKILVPASLVEKDLIEEEPKSPKGIKAPIQVTTPTSKTRQNPFRSSRQDVLENIRPRDKFGARRIRSSGRGRYSVTKHKGLDLVASIGTPLYPVESGTLLYLGKERNRKLWRNGIVAEYRTNSGILVKYIHLSWVNKKIKSGQAIELNAFLGKVGITGNASKDNPHVHIQVIVAGRIVDPFPYVVI